VIQSRLWGELILQCSFHRKYKQIGRFSKHASAHINGGVKMVLKNANFQPGWCICRPQYVSKYIFKNVSFTAMNENSNETDNSINYYIYSENYWIFSVFWKCSHVWCQYWMWMKTFKLHGMWVLTVPAAGCAKLMADQYNCQTEKLDWNIPQLKVLPTHREVVTVQRHGSRYCLNHYKDET
jgi:hypothetical protein